MTEANLGNTYLELARRAAVAAAKQAIRHLRSALEVFDSGQEKHFATEARQRRLGLIPTLPLLAILAQSGHSTGQSYAH